MRFSRMNQLLIPVFYDYNNEMVSEIIVFFFKIRFIIRVVNELNFKK